MRQLPGKADSPCAIGGSLLGNGFHRSLVLDIPSADVSAANCGPSGSSTYLEQVTMLLTLPEAVYLDPFELDNIRQLNTSFPRVTVLGRQDLEMCVPTPSLDLHLCAACARM